MPSTRTTFALIAALMTAAPVGAEVILNDAKSQLYEADYAAVLAENGIPTGVAVYGAHDADYDVYLTDAAVFPPLLGQYDADYEVMLDRASFTETVIALR